ncbi:MAG: SDR family NAD(P)-dependent oxidoreductase [Promethearchaeota archaeon]
MGRMDNKVALVAGNLGTMKKEKFILGLGGYIAKTLADEGAKVIVSDLDKNIIDECVKALNNPNIKGKWCDYLAERVAKVEKYETERGTKTNVIWEKNPVLDFVKEIVEEYGEINAVVSNFDYYEKSKITDITEELYVKLRDMNIKPMFNLMAALRETLAEQAKKTGKFARIVLMTSMAGKAGLAMASVYSAFKASVIGLNKTLAREFGRFASVNAVAMAPLSDKKLQGPKARMKKQFFITSSDMAKMDITPQHIAPLVALLCSEEGAGINGQTISVDGGLWLKLEQ